MSLGLMTSATMTLMHRTFAINSDIDITVKEFTLFTIINNNVENYF